MIDLMTNLYATIEAATAYASRVLADCQPGSAVYIGEVKVDGHRRGYRVVLAGMWPDAAWQGRAQFAQDGALGQSVECRVIMVLRKPVDSPQELTRHTFIVGRMPRPITTPPGPA